jgi:DNA-binding response OmpR family regulator
LKLVRNILQIKGYQTFETETGEEGVRLARERRPALIRMDIHCPASMALRPCKGCGSSDSYPSETLDSPRSS